MPDKLTDNEIVKALEWLTSKINEYCEQCDYKNSEICDICFFSKTKLVLDLINHQDEEINRLKAENERLQDAIDEQDIEIASLWKRIEDAKAEAYKEFAEKLHEELRIYGIKDKFNKSVFLNVVNKAKKELVGEDNESKN